MFEQLKPYLEPEPRLQKNGRHHIYPLVSDEKNFFHRDQNAESLEVKRHYHRLTRDTERLTWKAIM